MENRVNKVERFVNSKKLRKGPEEEKIEGKTMEEKEDIGKGYDKSHFPFFIRAILKTRGWNVNYNVIEGRKISK